MFQAEVTIVKRCVSHFAELFRETVFIIRIIARGSATWRKKKLKQFSILHSKQKLQCSDYLLNDRKWLDEKQKYLLGFTTFQTHAFCYHGLYSLTF